MTRSLIRIATVSLALVALAAPAAVARPADMPAAPAQHSADTSGFPVRPVLDRSPSSASSQPAAVPVAPADHGVKWTTIAIGIAGGVLGVGAVADIAARTRRAGGARATA
jgi:hypothetical protein